MSVNVQCWKCGKQVDPDIQRSSECKDCSADLKVCVMCKSYNPAMSDHCDEPAADYVNEIKRANFCDYFKVKTGAYQKTDSTEKDKAHEELNALFGISTNEEKDKNDNSELESIFKKN